MARPSPLRLARIASGFRLIDVQRKTGIHESRLSRIERGEVEPRETEIGRLLRLYGSEWSAHINAGVSSLG